MAICLIAKFSVLHSTRIEVHIASTLPYDLALALLRLLGHFVLFSKNTVEGISKINEIHFLTNFKLVTLPRIGCSPKTRIYMATWSVWLTCIYPSAPPIVVIVNRLAVTPVEISALTKIVRYPQLEK